MKRSNLAWWAVAAAAVTVVLHSQGLLLVGLVGIAVFALLIRLDGPAGRPAAKRHIKGTRALAVAAMLALVAITAQLEGIGAPLGLFVFAALVAVAGLDLVVAVVVTGRVRVAMAVDGTEITVGQSTVARVHVTGPALPVTLRVVESELAAAPDVTDAVDLRPEHRGVLAALPLAVQSTGLCGLVGFARTWPLVLEAPVFVGPAMVSPGRPFPDLGGRWGEGAQIPSATGDVVRGVRDYVPGDRRSQVHWRASARTGRLVVKELDEPNAPRLRLVLDLGFGGQDGERAASRAAWYIDEARRRGADIVLESREADGIRTAQVASASEAIRRLAAAVAGPLPPSPELDPGSRGVVQPTWPRGTGEPAGSGGPMQPAGSGGPMQPAGSGGPMQPAGSGGPMQPAGSGGPMQPAGSGGPMQPAGSGGRAQPGWRVLRVGPEGDRWG